jgi:hypothetical protein
LGGCPVEEAKLWILATGFMALLGFLLSVLLPLWLKHGFGSSNTAFINKYVAPRSHLLRSGFVLDDSRPAVVARETFVQVKQGILVLHSWPAMVARRC